MSRDAQEILKDALALPVEERSELVDSLLESLEPDPEIEEAWRQEVVRRAADVDAGRIKTTPWPEVRARLIADLSDDES
jgi:putative addiction module component (TIGR02574 family)